MSAVPTIESFEDVRQGHRVRFYPRDAIGGAQGLRKAITGRIRNLDPIARTVQVGDWIIPLRKVRRLSSDVYHSWSKVARKAERALIYGKLKPADKKRLESCAKDARQSFLATTKYTGPLNKGFYSEMKRARESYMRRHGIQDFTDKGQCEALPKFLERALATGQVPELKGIEYTSADNGTLGVGDEVTIGGHAFKFARYTEDGNVLLKDGYEISVPAEYVPRDKGAPVRSVLKKLKFKRKERLARWKDQKEWCYCFGRDAGGRFTSLKEKASNPRPRIVVDTDLLGRRSARLDGHSGSGEQLSMFERDHALAPEETEELQERQRWRTRRDREDRRGQRDMFENPIRRRRRSRRAVHEYDIPWWALLGSAALLYWFSRKQSQAI